MRNVKIRKTIPFAIASKPFCDGSNKAGERRLITKTLKKLKIISEDGSISLARGSVGTERGEL